MHTAKINGTAKQGPLKVEQGDLVSVLYTIEGRVRPAIIQMRHSTHVMIVDGAPTNYLMAVTYLDNGGYDWLHTLLKAKRTYSIRKLLPGERVTLTVTEA